LLLFIAFALSDSLRADEVYNINFAVTTPSVNYIGAGVIGNSGDYWNYSNTASTGNSQMLPNGGSADVALGLGGEYSFQSNTGKVSGSYLSGYISGTTVMDFNVYKPNKLYKLYIYSHTSSAVATLQGLTLVGTGSHNFNGTLYNYNLYHASTGIDGIIHVTGLGDINGMQITPTAVPEPDTFVLMGIGGLIIAAYARTRQKTYLI